MVLIGVCNEEVFQVCPVELLPDLVARAPILGATGVDQCQPASLAIQLMMHHGARAMLNIPDPKNYLALQHWPPFKPSITR